MLNISELWVVTSHLGLQLVLAILPDLQNTGFHREGLKHLETVLNTYRVTVKLQEGNIIATNVFN